MQPNASYMLHRTTSIATILASAGLMLLTACGTPTTNDVKRALSGNIEDGMLTQDAVANLKNIGFDCERHQEKFRCYKKIEKLLPPVTCGEAVDFIQTDQNTVSGISVEETMCLGGF